MRTFNILDSLNPWLNSSTFITDYKHSFTNISIGISKYSTARLLFPSKSTVHGEDYSDQQCYAADRNFNLQARYSGTLAFVLLADVIMALDSLTESLFYAKNEEVEVLKNYFEDTWIGRLTRCVCRNDPVF